MTWTYSGNPAASNRDAVRFLIGDTDSGDQLVSDEEIAFLLAEENTVRTASARACEAIAARFGRSADNSRSVGDLSLSESYSQRSASYLSLADRLAAAGAGDNHPVPVANPGALGPEFAVGEFDIFFQQ
jgi:hypothetical protein